MSDQNPDRFPEHDGIVELDNQLPRWWLNLFYITIVFSVIYMVWFHVLGLGPGGQEKRYETMMAQAEEAQAIRLARMLEELDLTTASNQPAVVNEGEQIYQTNCASCHHSTGRGLIGPNLTDAYWIHGARFEDTMHVIEVGVLEKGMQAWKDSLSLRQRHAVASYLFSIRGSNPPEPVRAPQGEHVEGSDQPLAVLNP